MAARRKATPVTLTPWQRDRLELAWFRFGNYGPKTTPGNHWFIQCILEHGIDIRPLITKRSRKSEIPTKECEEAVDRILRQDEAEQEAEAAQHTLRLLPSPERVRPHLKLDPEVLDMLTEMKRRQPTGGAPGGLQDDTPDAA